VEVVRVEVTDGVLVGYEEDGVRAGGLAVLLVLRLLVAGGAEAEGGGLVGGGPRLLLTDVRAGAERADGVGVGRAVGFIPAVGTVALPIAD